MSGFTGIRVPHPGGAVRSRTDVPPVDRPRSVFDMSCGRTTTVDTGFVVPIKMWQILPGDTWKVRMTAVARLIALIRPIMDDLYCDVHFVFVPWRIIWDNTEKFFGQQANPADSISYVLPKNEAFTPTIQGFHDYIGLNPTVGGGGGVIPLNALTSMPWRGYQKAWNDLYRDENLQNSKVFSTGDGPDAIDDGVHPRGKRGDRFTCSLPWPQKGATPVSFLPDGVGVTPTTANAVPSFWNKTDNTAAGNFRRNGAAASSPVVISGAAATAGQDLGWNNPNLKIDFATSGIATINAFRQAFAMQVYLERNARGGTRYVEYLKSQWGVTSSDARLQRPEYLGGASFPVNVSAIAQQSETSASSPQGNLSGIGTLSANGASFAKSFEEHGYVYCFVSFRSALSYQHGARPELFWSTVYDVPNPVFANIGEEPVYKREIFFNNDANDSAVFGYQERYSAMKQDWSEKTGYMRSSAGASSFDIWHLAQKFLSVPSLNDAFIQEPTQNVDRVVAVPDEPHWSFDAHFDAQVARCLPVYGVPGLSPRS